MANRADSDESTGSNWEEPRRPLDAESVNSADIVARGEQVEVVLEGVQQINRPQVPGHIKVVEEIQHQRLQPRAPMRGRGQREMHTGPVRGDGNLSGPSTSAYKANRVNATPIAEIYRRSPSSQPSTGSNEEKEGGTSHESH